MVTCCKHCCEVLIKDYRTYDALANTYKLKELLFLSYSWLN